MEELNINEWIYYFFCKNEEALHMMIEYYRPMVVSILVEKAYNIQSSQYYFLEALNRMDFVLVDCLYRYQYTSKGTFTAFFRRCVLNEAKNINKKLVREMGYEYNSFSLQDKINEEYRYCNSEFYTFEDSTLHDEVLLKLEVEYLLKDILNELNVKDHKVIYLKRQGLTTDEIAKILNVRQKTVRNRILRIKKYLIEH